LISAAFVDGRTSAMAVAVEFRENCELIVARRYPRKRLLRRDECGLMRLNTVGVTKLFITGQSFAAFPVSSPSKRRSHHLQRARADESTILH
jgi:hypothetical protein